MHNPRSHNPRKGSRFLDVKLFIVALTLAITIGLWNLFSSSAAQADKTAPVVQSAPPPSEVPTALEDLSPLPTLVSIVPVATLQPDQPAAVDDSLVNHQTASLRVVGIPTQVIVQKYNPAINKPAQSGGGGGGGGGKGGSKSVTKTKSS